MINPIFAALAALWVLWGWAVVELDAALGDRELCAGEPP